MAFLMADAAVDLVLRRVPRLDVGEEAVVAAE